MDGFKKIDIVKWERRGQFELFSAMALPNYGVSVRADVTGLVAHSKRTGESFFANLMYTAAAEMSKIDAFRLRMNGSGELYLCDVIDPYFTVRTPGGNYVNRGMTMSGDRQEFLARAHRVIADVTDDSTFSGGSESVAETARSDAGDVGIRPVYYFSCVNLIDFTLLSHPLPLGNHAELSIPRIVWGRYSSEGGHRKLSLSINVNHALVDGDPLCTALANIQAALDAFETV